MILKMGEQDRQNAEDVSGSDTAGQAERNPVPPPPAK
jgi:hypothetical protein